MLIALLIAAIQLDGAPRVGEPVRVRVSRDEAPVAGQPLQEIAPEGAVDAARRAAGTTDAQGEVLWTPARAGLVQLEAAGERQVVAVASDHQIRDLLPLIALVLGLGLPAWRIRKRTQP